MGSGGEVQFGLGGVVGVVAPRTKAFFGALVEVIVLYVAGYHFASVFFRVEYISQNKFSSLDLLLY